MLYYHLHGAAHMLVNKLYELSLQGPVNTGLNMAEDNNANFSRSVILFVDEGKHWVTWFIFVTKSCACTV
jgi:hypothetical protein